MRLEEKLQKVKEKLRILGGESNYIQISETSIIRIIKGKTQRKSARWDKINLLDTEVYRVDNDKIQRREYQSFYYDLEEGRGIVERDNKKFVIDENLEELAELTVDTDTYGIAVTGDYLIIYIAKNTFSIYDYKKRLEVANIVEEAYKDTLDIIHKNGHIVLYGSDVDDLTLVKAWNKGEMREITLYTTYYFTNIGFNKVEYHNTIYNGILVYGNGKYTIMSTNLEILAETKDNDDITILLNRRKKEILDQLKALNMGVRRSVFSGTYGLKERIEEV